ncbi:MAG TPA: hypothetical protein VGB64_00320 [Actinomycetota bacterium]
MRKVARFAAVLCMAVAATAAMATQASAATLVNLAGDIDDFGYGLGNPIPCVFFDNSGPGDLGVFDRELTSGDEVEAWTHTLGLPAGATVSSVFIEIREIFSDFDASSLTVDGTTMPFVVNGPSFCGPPVVQTFEFTGGAAAFANDGIIDLVFNENGDDIGLDWSRVTVEYTAGSDAAVRGLTVTPNGAGPGRAAVSVVVNNHGPATVTAPVTVSVTSQSGGSPWTSSPQTVTLRPGETRTMQFVALKPNAPGSAQYRVTACIRAPGDSHPADDCMSKTTSL